VGRDGLIDQGALDPHIEQVSDQPSRTSAPGGTGFDVVLGEASIVQQAELGHPFQCGGDGRPSMPLPLEAAGQVSSSERTSAECTQHGSERRLRISGRAQAIPQGRVHLGSYPELLSCDNVPGNRPEARPIDLDPYRVRAAGIGVERGDSGRSLHRLLVPLVTGSSADRNRRAHSEELLDLALDFGQEYWIIPEEELGVLPTLADPLIAVGVPGT
jgi:hypothetical protein